MVEDAEREPPVRLFSVEVKGGKLTRLTENRDWIDSVKVSPDGRWAVAIHQRSLSFQYDHKVPPVLDAPRPEGGQDAEPCSRARASSPRAPSGRPTRGASTSSSSTRPTRPTSPPPSSSCSTWTRRRAAAAPVDLQWTNGLGTPAGPAHRPTASSPCSPTGCASVRRATRAPAPGFSRQDLAGEHARGVFDWALGKDGETLVYEHSTAMKPAQWYRARLAGAAIEGAVRAHRPQPGLRGQARARGRGRELQGGPRRRGGGRPLLPDRVPEGEEVPALPLDPRRPGRRRRHGRVGPELRVPEAPASRRRAPSSWR